MTGRRYLLAALATTVVVAGCTAAGAQATGADQPSGSTGVSSATSAPATGGGTSATSAPAAGGGTSATSAPAVGGGTSATSSPATASGQAASGTSPLDRRPVGLDCTAAELKVTLGAGYGTAYTASGHAELALWFTNVGSRDCLMQGYPGVEVSGPAGALNAQRAAAGDAGQSLVTVPPGGTASALLGWEFFPQDGSAAVTTSDCPGYHATQLLVTAPDQTTSTVLAAPTALTPVCWEFVVDPVALGATGWS